MGHPYIAYILVGHLGQGVVDIGYWVCHRLCLIFRFCILFDVWPFGIWLLLFFSLFLSSYFSLCCLHLFLNSFIFSVQRAKRNSNISPKTQPIQMKWCKQQMCITIVIPSLYHTILLYVVHRRIRHNE